jgi:Beta-lactamase class C and other penicillin binding proteins
MKVFLVAMCSLLFLPAGIALDAVTANTGKRSTTAAPPVRLNSVDSIIQQAITDHNIPGAVLVVGHDGKIVYRKAYGERALEPRREAMTLDTVFDLASLTKVVATTTAVMQLMEQGKVRMNDPVAKYLPEFAQNGKEDITVRQLITHYSGMAPDLDLTTPWESKNTAYQLAFVEPPETTPDQASCIATLISSCWARWWKKCPARRLTLTQRDTFLRH